MPIEHLEATALAGTTSLNKFVQPPWAEIRPSKLPGMALFALLYMEKLSYGGKFPANFCCCVFELPLLKNAEKRDKQIEQKKVK
jgi:hypothetical protein